MDDKLIEIVKQCLNVDPNYDGENIGQWSLEFVAEIKKLFLSLLTYEKVKHKDPIDACKDCIAVRHANWRIGELRKKISEK